MIDYARTITVTIQPRGTLNAGGNYQYDGEAVTAKAWLQDKVRRDYGPNADVIYDRIFWLGPREVVANGDRIVYQGRNHEVVNVRQGRGFDDLQFLRVESRLI